MTVTIVGLASDHDGLSAHRHLGWNGRAATLTRSHHAVPLCEYRTVQPARIPLDIDHGQDVGDVRHLEADRAGLWAVATAAVDELATLDGPIYYSPSLTMFDDYTDVEMRALALTCQPASIAARPVTIVPGDLGLAAAGTTGMLKDRIVRAYEQDLTRHGRPHRISGLTDFVTRASPLPDDYIDPPVTVWADRPSRTIWCRVPSGANATRRLRLLYNGSPVGYHQPNLDLPEWDVIGFTASRTPSADTALEFVADEILQGCRVRRFHDGTWSSVELVPD